MREGESERERERKRERENMNEGLCYLEPLTSGKARILLVILTNVVSRYYIMKLGNIWKIYIAQ